jgi:hypothetical protein
MTGSNPVQSARWPGVVCRLIGRQRRSAARCSLVVSPPRERPRASLPVVSVRAALAGSRMVRGGVAAGACGVLVSADRGGVDSDGPVLAFLGVAVDA